MTVRERNQNLAAKKRIEQEKDRKKETRRKIKTEIRRMIRKGIEENRYYVWPDMKMF